MSGKGLTSRARRTIKKTTKQLWNDELDELERKNVGLTSYGPTSFLAEPYEVARLCYRQ